MNATQIMTTVKSASEAEIVLSAMTIQDDFISGRILCPTNVIGKSTWRVQVFVQRMCDDAALPEGCRNVVLPKRSILV